MLPKITSPQTHSQEAQGRAFFLSAILTPGIMLREKDVMLPRVIVRGEKAKSKAESAYETVDYYREGVTSMARTTASTGAIAAIMLTQKRITQTGAVPPETIFAGRLFRDLMGELATKDVKVSKLVTTKTNLH